jgi:hypothetical protein
VVSEMLANEKKLHSDGEIMKECLEAVAYVASPDKKKYF